MRPLLTFLLLFVPLCGLFPEAVPAQEMFESSAGRVAFVELYTSEGCRSCPPAEKWFSEFEKSPELWKSIIPVSFHVTYWNRLGWNDRYAHWKYDLRQRRHAEIGDGAIYTPAVYVDGEPWPGWYQGSLPPLTHEKTGTLKVYSADANQYRFDFFPSGTVTGKLTAHLALLGFDVKTQIKAGENKGLQLTHDFVVLDYKEKKMESRDVFFIASLGPMKPKRGYRAERFGIAAWVSSDKDGHRPIQSTGGYLNAGNASEVEQP